MAIDDLAIRRGVLEDARAVAELKVRAWRWAYRGLMPESLLAGLSVEKREATWRKALSPSEGEHRLWLAERGGRLVGFASTGLAQDAPLLPRVAEVFAIYLEQDAQGTGVGRALFAHAVDDLSRRGFKEAILWVLATNDLARRFYEAAGWRAGGGEKTEIVRGAELHEVRYRRALASESG